MKHDTVSQGMIWKFAEKMATQIVTFIVTVVLSRIVDPEEYGTIALVLVFITVANVFIDYGLGNALIQRREFSQEAFSTAFYFNLILSVVLYIVIYLLAPHIGIYYKNASLSSALRVAGIAILISGIRSIQQAFISKNMLFRRTFVATFIGALVSGVIGIGAAYLNYGVWALVIQYVTNSFITTLVIVIITKWYPTKTFSISELRKLLSFGWKITAAGMLDSISTQIRNLLIGKVYTSGDLAYYSKGEQIPSLVITNVDSTINAVMFPTLAKEQNSMTSVLASTRKALRISTYIIMPLLMGLFTVAEDAVVLVFTQKWVSCVPYLRIYCLLYLTQPLFTTTNQALKAIGRSDLFLIIKIISRFIGLISLILSVKYGVLAIALAALASQLFTVLINVIINKHFLSYSVKDFVLDIVKPTICTTVMCLMVLVVQALLVSLALRLIAGICFGIVAYIIMSVILKDDSFAYLLNKVKRVIKHA